jgi:predicted AAA+ superfamily ATPase
MIRKSILKILSEHLFQPRGLIQILAGPRQSGKTAMARQVMEALGGSAHYASADEPTLKGQEWIVHQWEIARMKAREGEALLILDEIQKSPGWAECVRELWDADTQEKLPLKVLLLGSSPFLLEARSMASLIGCVEVVPVPHWSFLEVEEEFGWTLEQFLYFGAYPGAANLMTQPLRWRQFVMETMIETGIARDILLVARVDKPALLRRLFQLVCDYSGQVFSYQKMLTLLVDAGNTVTLAHYLELLRGAGMAAGLPKFTAGRKMQRGSSPKLQVLNTALLSAVSGYTFSEMRQQPDDWARLMDTAVGAHLWNGTLGQSVQLSYWKERHYQVDFVMQRGRTLVAIQVRRAGRRDAMSGLDAFRKRFNPKKTVIVGLDGIPFREFLATPALRWLE